LINYLNECRLAPKPAYRRPDGSQGASASGGKVGSPFFLKTTALVFQTGDRIEVDADKGVVKKIK
jgi:hypothetical protein